MARRTVLVVSQREDDTDENSHVDEVIEETSRGGIQRTLGEERFAGHLEGQTRVDMVNGVSVESVMLSANVGNVEVGGTAHAYATAPAASPARSCMHM